MENKNKLTTETPTGDQNGQVKNSPTGKIKSSSILIIVIACLVVIISGLIFVLIYQPTTKIVNNKKSDININKPNKDKPEPEKNQFNNTQVAKMICPLMGKGKTENNVGNLWSSDLGITFIHNNQLYLMVGDVFGGDIFAPNVLAQTADQEPTDCLDLTWQIQPDAGPRYFFPKTGNMDDGTKSTVPGGGISINNIIYVFLQDITHWADWNEGGDNVTHGRSILIKSVDNGKTFEEPWRWEIDNKFVNIAPILGPHPSDPAKEVVYLVGSGTYRAAPVYLAYVEKENLENRSQYKYFSGWQNQAPIWSSNESEARPIVDDVKAGEISVRWNNYLDKYLLAFFDYNSGDSAYLRSAEKPWGPWSEPQLVYSGNQRYDWYQSYSTKSGKTAYWGTPYGFYLLPERYNKANDQIIYWVLSLWTPYNIYLMETDLAKVFK